MTRPRTKSRFVQATLVLLCALAISGLAVLQPAAVAADTSHVYLPWLYRAVPVNPTGRQEAADLYLQQYLSSAGTPVGWTGNLSGCNPGTTGLAFRDAVLRRINYFRTMAGVPTVTLNDEYNRKAQAAALMMSANRDLSHSPPSGWQCYSSDGAQAAGSSNLCLGCMGWDAISAYMLEGGAVGHRRWVLHPQTQQMGSGDIPYVQGYASANALWVFDHLWEPGPATRYEFVAWPPPGYVPYPVVNDHWSFSYPQADFAGATVTMTTGGAGVSVTLEPVFVGYGENTLVWVPQGVTSGGAWPKPAVDTAYTVQVHNVIIGGQSREFSYTVIVFDPAL
jgi:hypothetical protein